MNSDQYWAKIAELNRNEDKYKSISDRWQDVAEQFNQINSIMISAFEALRPAMQSAVEAVNESMRVLKVNMEPMHRLMAYRSMQKRMPDRLAYWLAYHLPTSLIGNMENLWLDIKDENPREE